MHRVLIYARAMALDGESSQRIADVLDWAELLPRFLAAEQNRTAEYRDALIAIAEKEPLFNDAVAVFDWSKNPRW